MKLWLKNVCVGAAIASSFWATFALGQTIREDSPESYVVKSGDTLWDISGVFLQDPWRWPEIWHVNEQVANPHLIYPGDILTLVYVDGKPRLIRRNGVVKLSPQMRSTSINDAIASIPLDSIREFFTANRILSEEEFADAPYVLAGQESHILVGAGDAIYVRPELPQGVDIFQILRQGEKYKDPKTGKVLGVRAQAMGRARRQLSEGEISKMKVFASNAEILPGDKVFPLAQDMLDPTIFPVVPDIDFNGSILAVEGGVTFIGTLDVVAINIGANQGLQNGHLLAVYERGETVRDQVNRGEVKLPDERAGLTLIFKVFEKMSYGLILEADKPLAVGHVIKTL